MPSNGHKHIRGWKRRWSRAEAAPAARPGSPLLGLGHPSREQSPACLSGASVEAALPALCLPLGPAWTHNPPVGLQQEDLVDVYEDRLQAVHLKPRGQTGPSARAWTATVCPLHHHQSERIRWGCRGEKTPQQSPARPSQGHCKGTEQGREHLEGHAAVPMPAQNA